MRSPTSQLFKRMGGHRIRVVVETDRKVRTAFTSEKNTNRLFGDTYANYLSTIGRSKLLESIVSSRVHVHSLHTFVRRSRTKTLFYCRPRRRCCWVSRNEALHVFLGNTVDVDALPISCKDPSNILCIILAIPPSFTRSQGQLRHFGAVCTYNVHALILARRNSDTVKNGKP